MENAKSIRVPVTCAAMRPNNTRDVNHFNFASSDDLRGYNEPITDGPVAILNFADHSSDEQHCGHCDDLIIVSRRVALLISCQPSIALVPFVLMTSITSFVVFVVKRTGANPVRVLGFGPPKFGCGGLMWLGPPRKFH